MYEDEVTRRGALALGLAAIGGLFMTMQPGANPTLGFFGRKGKPEHPAMNLPRKMRQRNWIGGPWQNGSCVVASMISLLRWQGKYALANRLRRRYGGGQDFWSWNSILDREGIRYAVTYNKRNVAFLERAIKTRRGCMVAIEGLAHMVCLVDLTPTKACILDNNDTSRYIWRDRSEFLADWFGAHSWALTPVYSPTSPRSPQNG